MTNFANVIDSLHKEYTKLQAQFKFQMESLIKVNEKLRVEITQVETRNEQLRLESTKLKSENKQLHGEQAILVSELNEQYRTPTNMDDALAQILTFKNEIIKLITANQAFNKQLSLSTEMINHLQKVNLRNQKMNTNIEEQYVIRQSLESELEREKRVRALLEYEKNEAVNKLKLFKEKYKLDSIESHFQANLSEFEDLIINDNKND